MREPLLQLSGIRRHFGDGERRVEVLKGIDLTIARGEMVAIVGASGSGKSTLLNILGCLDQPSEGSYRVAGRETSRLTADALATLRREHFGFIFQRYHLLGDLSARDNVALPALYAGLAGDARKARAERLLQRLGLGSRLDYKPSQLSGGQQQRVSIARALINGGQVILADEPTGALDSQSGAEVLGILGALHRQGHTLVLVTHDMAIAEQAERIIELKDGAVVADRRREPTPPSPAPTTSRADTGGRGGLAGRLGAAFKMALLAMRAQRMRTFLTMLGIIIGIAAVVSVVALGRGSQQQVLANINAMGTSTLEIFPGSGFGDRRAEAVQTLRVEDAEALAGLGYVHSVTPSLATSVTLRRGSQAVLGSVNGVGEQFFQVRGYRLLQGMLFDAASVTALAQEVVIDENSLARLFGAGESPLGQVILLGSLPCRVIGVVARNQSGFGSDENLNVWIPHTTAMTRMLGQSHLRSISVRVQDEVALAAAEDGISRLLRERHGAQDFFVLNTDSIRQAITSTNATLTLLIAMIALISLVVGGIGVMNIMLVSVSERTREIGVRMAVGARTGDILQQFLIEAVLVCLLGGAAGVLLSLLIGVLFEHFSSQFTLSYSLDAVLMAFFCSSLIGVLFGFFPARRAARMDPIHALERE
ncbi:MacB family efflux pump subunit [Aeromonas hydrophila]|uniref:Macrolide export ATP-binding/permease protein MacB 1 n=1 Tax=Aeromonas hydrophila subsp. hydrophila (strain ATCC 7966 / DSM 30187 / BCRC 13018 / CCUG 14551 / JCM 1027 / KCTC 2358 / NCIMB 9240 / NCTC 8049) TaxID=380703 RepID=MACB1_AERHH|nr:MacB family efflux pump subunit [Aeromonas hydrophila]A0KGB3.1 RecName: Full=Macrolide export ATP-binding/permease protein MacB 1 [Aeromonas hydrophila subsp. hydrophila ATCC 7966]ABK38211.1 macrolide-specific ABC-type efflux carrier [Aeromonas hydrophila subsp. hydrophila ATCC 7966]MBS4673917.1 MacB family efflux pump subunit [Aeromonas hydrophila]OOD35178.1 macrolide ABC transporter permease/ATP-binding protein MacB [Aeromonas hydrophila]SUU17813.1 macrolide-specific ABC-type efflux carri